MPLTPVSTLHFAGHFDDPYTGAERELLDIRRLLQGRRPVQLWSDIAPHRFYAEQGVKAVKPFAGQFPKDGVLLVGGVHVVLGHWLQYARFERVILLYNLVSHERLFVMLSALRALTTCEVEVVFVSRTLQLSVSLPGRVINSLIDLEPFLAQRPATQPGLTAVRPFTVGRHSRDISGKHHSQDPSLYRMLAANGMRVRVMGGLCLSGELGGVDGVELLPAGAESAADFCRSLDVFFYRTGTVIEAYGRVVVEAMASGLPVVVGQKGGYEELISPGTSGLFVTTQEEAYNTLLALNKQPALARQIADAGRNEVISRHGIRGSDAVIQSWLLSGSC